MLSREVSGMKKYIPYAIAAMNGADIIVAVVCIIMVWSFKGAFLGERRTSHAVQQSNDRQGRR